MPNFSTASRKGRKMSFDGGLQRLLACRGRGGSGLRPWGKMQLKTPFSSTQQFCSDSDLFSNIFGPFSTKFGLFSFCFGASTKIFVSDEFSNHYLTENVVFRSKIDGLRSTFSPSYEPIVCRVLLSITEYFLGVNGGSLLGLILLGLSNRSLASDGKTIQRSSERLGSLNNKVWKFNTLDFTQGVIF